VASSGSRSTARRGSATTEWQKISPFSFASTSQGAYAATSKLLKESQININEDLADFGRNRTLSRPGQPRRSSARQQSSQNYLKVQRLRGRYEFLLLEAKRLRKKGKKKRRESRRETMRPNLNELAGDRLLSKITKTIISNFWARTQIDELGGGRISK